MQIPILSGIATDENADFRSSYPINLVPIPKSQGISNGYLRPAPGIVHAATGPGLDRGGIEWNGVCYRVMGTKLVSVAEDWTITTLGDVGGAGQVQFDYSFDRLAVCSSGDFYYWDGSTLTQVTDADLGEVRRFVWIDSYFATTDGTNVPVTELVDPTQVDALKYGSSEVDPDEVMALFKIGNELIAVNRHTVEQFNNVGGTGFPFARIEGAFLPRGAIGPYACCVYNEAVAFVGGGRNEGISIWLGLNGQTGKISTREIDQILEEYSTAQLRAIVCEPMVTKSQNELRVRLPDQELVYDSAASQTAGQPVWHILSSTLDGYGQYRCVNRVRCYGKWIVGDPQSASLGYLDDAIGSHWGQPVGWQFDTPIAYNDGAGMIIHELELVALSGRMALGVSPTVATLSSVDGETWTAPAYIPAGTQGDRSRRLRWLDQGVVEHWRQQRFKGTSDAMASFARLEARIEPLQW